MARYATREEIEEDRMMKWFRWAQLPDELHSFARYFQAMAQDIVNHCEPGPERTVALRKLLEAKDAAVRAKLQPGG